MEVGHISYAKFDAFLGKQELIHAENETLIKLIQGMRAELAFRGYSSGHTQS